MLLNGPDEKTFSPGLVRNSHERNSGYYDWDVLDVIRSAIIDISVNLTG